MRSVLTFVVVVVGLAVTLPSGVALAADAAAAVIHVAPGGNDRDDGSAGRPLKTLSEALSKAQPGQTIRLAAGQYAGGVTTSAAGVSVEGPRDAIVSGPPSGRGIQVLHDKTVLRGFTIEGADIGIWLQGVNACTLDGLHLRDMNGEGVRIKNQSCDNTVRNCRFDRMGRTGFDAAAGKKNGEAVYIGTAPEQRAKNGKPEVPDRCLRNVVEDCVFQTEAAEAVDIKEDSEQNIVRRCAGSGSRDPDGAVFGARGDNNRFEHCLATAGVGHGFRFGGDTVKRGKHGQASDRTYGAGNVMRNCRAEGNAKWGAAPMVRPQDIDDSNVFEGNGSGAVKK